MQVVAAKTIEEQVSEAVNNFCIDRGYVAATSIKHVLLTRQEAIQFCQEYNYMKRYIGTPLMLFHEVDGTQIRTKYGTVLLKVEGE